MPAPKNFGLSDSLIDAARTITEAKKNKDLAAAIDSHFRAVKHVTETPPDCGAGRHQKSKGSGNTCKNCGVALCTHHRSDLRGCMLPKGHQGSHHNAWGASTETWKDKDGVFVNSHKDWNDLIDGLGPKH